MAWSNYTIKKPKPKDLLLLPAMLALALQAEGSWLRSEIIWHKPNPMPESVRDRPTSAHEKLFLLSRSAKYFYDAEAVRVASTPGSVERPKYKKPGHRMLVDGTYDNGIGAHDERIYASGELQWSQPAQRLDHPEED